MDKVLIDTDVLMDFFIDRKPFSNYAARVFSLCEAKNISGYITPVICSNAYYLLRQLAKHEKVIVKLSQLLSIIDVLFMDKDVVLRALNSDFKDFEDALQNFAALKSGKINIILTRNIKDYLKSDLAVMTPQNYLDTKLKPE